MANQEPKQIKCYCGHTTMCDCGEQPKQQTKMSEATDEDDLSWWKKVKQEIQLL